MLLTRSFYPFRTWRGAGNDVERLRREMDRVLGAFAGDYEQSAPSGVYPLINVAEDNDKYVLTAELPGMTPDDLNISLMGKSLTLQGERLETANEEGARFHRKERSFSSFNRVIGLPTEVQADKVEAKTINGVLTVIMPKAEEVKPRQITVKA